MIELIYCEVLGHVIGYRTKTKTVIFEWNNGKPSIMVN
jgi:hypothetical protein